jgi:hypothetical protein
MGLKGRPDLNVFTGLDPVCPKCGPYEASEEICPGHGQRKKSVGKGVDGCNGLTFKDEGVRGKEKKKKNAIFRPERTF